MKKVSNKKPYNLKTLPSGLRIMTIPMKTTTTTVLVLVEAGSKYETKKENGMTLDNKTKKTLEKFSDKYFDIIYLDPPYN